MGAGEFDFVSGSLAFEGDPHRIALKVHRYIENRPELSEIKEDLASSYF
jgi:hypothetical protein